MLRYETILKFTLSSVYLELCCGKSFLVDCKVVCGKRRRCLFCFDYKCFVYENVYQNISRLELFELSFSSSLKALWKFQKLFSLTHHDDFHEQSSRETKKMLKNL